MSYSFTVHRFHICLCAYFEQELNTPHWNVSKKGYRPNKERYLFTQCATWAKQLTCLYRAVLQQQRIQYHLNLPASRIDLCDHREKNQFHSITQGNLCQKYVLYSIQFRFFCPVLITIKVYVLKHLFFINLTTEKVAKTSC